MSDPSGTPESQEIRSETSAFRPLVFGEALFDRFPDGSQVLGGAPFNVAWHLRGFKATPLMVTAVGRDPEGAEILRRMGVWGMDTAGVQIHPTRSTGRVAAHLVGGDPHYDIEPNQAYDDIALNKLPNPAILSRIQLLYHGSLGIREGGSRKALELLRDQLKVPVLIDVNLRDPWWRRDRLLPLLKGTDWVKVNREEAGVLSQQPVHDDEALRSVASAFRADHRIGTLVVTLGQEGAMAVTDRETIRVPAPKVGDTVDSVGAGDAFSAVLALGAQGSWPLERTLRRAVEFAAELCKVRGATVEDPEMYGRHQRRWLDAE